MKAELIFLVLAVLLVSCESKVALPDDQDQMKKYGYVIRTSNQLFSKLKDPDFVFVDTRHFSDYEDAHIPGAVPVDERGGTARLTLHLIDTSKTLIVYCGTAVCDTKIFPVLKEMGFKKIIYLSDGFGGWINKGFPFEKSAY